MIAELSNMKDSGQLISMVEVIQCLCIVTWFKTKLWVMCVQRCFDRSPLKVYPTLVKRRGKLITEVLQICNGRELRTNQHYPST